MLQRVMLDGIELPRLYIAENNVDVNIAKSKGIPFVRWNQGQDALIKCLLRPLLEDMFPHIKWDMVLGRKKRFRTKVEIDEIIEAPTQDMLGHELDGHAERLRDWEPSRDEERDHQGIPMREEDGVITETSVIADNERLFDSGCSAMVKVHNLDIQDYVGDMSSYVNIEMLQRLRLMPAFLGNILDCVKLNIGSGMYWNEGYNKRLGLPVGRYNSSGQLPNLVILDVSGSIPRGISATMISLIDTLRTQLSADLIITSSNSRFYPMGTELPDPQTIRDLFGYGNESFDFFGILNHNIKGRHYGHVFSFGDNDTPNYSQFRVEEGYSLEGTVIEHVHHYHTGFRWGKEMDDENKAKHLKTGYAKWCHMLAKQPREEYDQSWCKVIRDC